MKYKAKETSYMIGDNEVWIIKDKIYDLKNDGYCYHFKSEFDDNHAASFGNLDKYFEKVEEGMKFKVGDKVRVRKDLEAGKCYGSNGVADGMIKYLGKSANVVNIYNGQYLLDIVNGSWFWTDEMLEPAQQLSFDVNKYIGKAIRCDTEEKAKQLLEYLDKQGYKWASGGKLTGDTLWDTYKENTCYCVLENKIIIHNFKKYFIGTKRNIIKFENLLQGKPFMCEIIGKEVGEEFCIKNYSGNPCYINKLGEIRNSQGECVRASVLTRAVNHPKHIEDVPAKPIYTDKQLEVFKILKDVFHLNFVTRDKGPGDRDELYGYIDKPKKDYNSNTWGWQPTMVELSNLDKDIFSFLKWEDKEPFDLAKALEK